MIATVSTIVVFGLIVVVVGSSENWEAVRDRFFDGAALRESFPDVAGGFVVNLQLFGWAMLAIPPLSLLVAVMRSFRGPVFFPVRLLAIVFVDVLRGIPTILLVLLLGFGVPALDLEGLPRDAWFWGMVALVLSYSAYTAEIFRAGIDSVPDSQRSSARAIGLTQWQSLRHAIIPQAIRNVVPALMNTVVSLQKDVALISVVGVRDAVREAQIYTSDTFDYTSYIGATLLFLLVSVPLTRFVDWYTARDRARRQRTGA